MKWNPFALEAEAKKEVYKLIDKNLSPNPSLTFSNPIF